MNLVCLEFNSDLIKHCTLLEPKGDFPDLRETLDYFKVRNKCLITYFTYLYSFATFNGLYIYNLQSAFDPEEAKKAGSILPKKGVDEEYDAILEELAEIKKAGNNYLEQQKKFFGVKVSFFGHDRKRYQLEVPDSQVKKVNSSYELQSQRKGFKRYYTAEAKVCISVNMLISTLISNPLPTYPA